MHPGGTSFAGHPPCVYKVWVLKDVPPAGHALWAEVGRGIIFVTSGESAGQHKKLPVRFVMGFVGFHSFELYMLALVGRPSLHSYDACMVYWVQGVSRRNCRPNQGKLAVEVFNVGGWLTHGDLALNCKS